MNFPPLNLPKFDFKLRLDNDTDKLQIFDIIRKKYVVITQEEWVRQHFIHYLVYHKNFPASLIKVERLLKLNQLTKRTDILIHNNAGKPLLLVECKASSELLNENVFNQILRYNLALNVPYIVATNGLHHIVCSINQQEKQHNYLPEVPDFKTISVRST